MKQSTILIYKENPTEIQEILKNTINHKTHKEMTKQKLTDLHLLLAGVAYQSAD